MFRFISFFLCVLSLHAAGPAQIIVIPSAEMSQTTPNGNWTLTRQGQMRAAYLLGFLLLPTNGRSPIINKQTHPFSDMYVAEGNNSSATTQTLLPLFREGNYSSIETTQNQITLNTVPQPQIPTLLATIFQNSQYANQTVVICIYQPLISQLFLNYPRFTDKGTNFVYQILNGSNQVVSYEGVPANGFYSW